MPRARKPHSPFRYFNSSPEVIRLVVMMYVRFPLSLRNVEDLLFEHVLELKVRHGSRHLMRLHGGLESRHSGCSRHAVDGEAPGLRA
jgi:hypothetical protein